MANVPFPLPIPNIDKVIPSIIIEIIPIKI